MYASEGFITFVEVKLRSGLARILLPKSMLANRVLEDGNTPPRRPWDDPDSPVESRTGRILRFAQAARSPSALPVHCTGHDEAKDADFVHPHEGALFRADQSRKTITSIP